ncbi:MAG TPA: wax ester/triacylglycerol synthase family O-acyltransferase [Burkholderiaceae bacterium]|nr:wax ester/triacylglycerol synthase family O-acyltransferase [Burkholderiaceae bacterium]
MRNREPLSIVDTAWLRMDRPTNLMMICGVMMFADRLELQRVREVVRTRLLCFHRFRQCVVERGSTAYWETDAHFDLDWHVRRIALPGAAGRIELEEVVSDLVSTPLDPTKPMWQFHLIDGTDDSSTLVLRIHHCYGDGFALTHVVASLTDTDPDKPRPPAEDVGQHDVARSAWERMLGPLTEAVGDALRLGLSAVETGRDWIAHPAHAIAYGKTGLDLAGELAFIANMAPDSHTRFKGTLGVMKRVAWAEPLPLSEFKALCQALGCSVNDVLLACVSGALRTYLLACGEAVDGVDVRALVPVNLRPPGPITELGNHFGLVFLDLPIGVEQSIARVFEVKKRMSALKNSQQPVVALGILAGMGIAPKAIKEKVLETLAANASAVITNVRGVPEPCFLAGKQITRQIFWVPQSGGIGMGISILSYAGQVDFGVMTDVKRVPDPAAIVQCFAAEFETLLLEALMMPWPEKIPVHKNHKRAKSD